ncbi:MAG: sigma-54-dependent Fis family transcriptional regulator [Syntrophus sp. (in: bacteria)]|nr:sigma-54-dependent Fis family transcriptional regulator [Syntrophus sp. (in: bacteria)]
MIRVLLVDDEEELVKAFKTKLKGDGMEVSTAHTAEGAMSLLRKRSFDVAVFDIRLPDESGTDLLKMAKIAQPTMEAIMLTGHASIETAIQSMKLGAYDYLKKPCELSELSALIQKGYEKKALSDTNIILKEHVRKLRSYESLLGESEQIREIKRLINLSANSDIPVLILGETGTGKELVAYTIHDLSPRRDKEFVVINASNLQDTMLESELFGYKKGAFTGAEKDKLGLLEIADKGTFFIDELAEMSPPIQAKLLRVLDKGFFRKLGDTKETHVDVRFVCATNVPLDNALKESGFRKDLFYRLNNFMISIPPLRERSDDILLLAVHFLQKYGGRSAKKRLSREAMDTFMAFSWPGNVRELSNVVQRACLLSGVREEIYLSDLPGNLLNGSGEKIQSAEASPGNLLEDLERSHIERMVKIAGGNISKAARLLGISRRRIYAKLKGSSE